MSLMPVAEALQRLLASAAAHQQQPVRVLSLTDALGQVLAEPVCSAIDVPPWDNSAMDGYALAEADLAQAMADGLPVSQRITAGVAPAALQPGTCARIFTGAPLPAGANAVQMQENTELLTDGRVRLLEPVAAGDNVRRQAQDVVSGQPLLAAGIRLRPQDLGVIASVGIDQVGVRTPLRVAVVSTGDELVEPGQPLSPGQIYNSNRFTLMGLLTEAGCEVVLCETLRDKREATRETLQRAAEAADLVITSGGVSVGEEDHVRAVLEESGSLSLWKMAIKPGKPVAFGAIGGTPVLGLPGNPGSVLVTFLMVGMPYIRKRQGRNPKPLSGERIPADFTIDSPSIRREFVRARKESRGSGPVVAAYPNQSSGILSSTCWADGLAVVPENSTVSPGDLLTYYSFAELLS